MGQDEETTHATAWTPRASRLVDFYGDELLIALVDEAAYIALRPVCDYLGLDWSAQRRRLYRT